LFQSYESGVITSEECGTLVDHAVIIYGYDTTDEIPHYLIKNSWGSAWGEGGYGKVAIESGVGICGINQFVAAPNVYGI
jgi:C1A family cysteine protease